MTRFDTTRWSMVLQAREDSAQARTALESLCRTYRPPVLAYIRRHVRNHETAEDLAQAFFTRFLEHAYHANADPVRGRFRAFLLTALKRFLIDADHEAHAIKRGGNIRFRSLEQDNLNDGALESIADAESPERAFERSWAVTLIDAAMQRLRRETAQAGKKDLFEQLREFLVERPDEADYARVAAALNLRRNTLAVTVHRLRHRLNELIRDELMQTTATDVELESEILDMRVVLGGTIG
jgi:RNA polymerase sigma-70 factor (ECF subfamily)